MQITDKMLALRDKDAFDGGFEAGLQCAKERQSAAESLAAALRATQLQLLQSNNQTEYAEEAHEMARAALAAWDKLK